MSSRRLIVNADDLGQCDGVNRGIAEAAERGIVRSASLMVRWPGAEPAARLFTTSYPAVSLGLHLDLAEWAFRDGAWFPLYQVVDPDDAAAVDDELCRQLGAFVRLTGSLPTHLDSHQHVHHHEPLRSRLLAAGGRLGIPVRGFGAVAYCGAFYGQTGKGDPYPEGITFEALVAVLDTLAGGTTELGCHPGADDLTGLDSMYRAERTVERRVLCDPRLPVALAERGITLASFAASFPGPKPNPNPTMSPADGQPPAPSPGGSRP
jgi:predicted glycoside hydrolase/deacetylase ChbG (UPF0249 family)